MLFTGDMGTYPESEILNAGYTVKSDVLKAGHHGSKTASSPEFLKAVAPDTVIITSAAKSQDNLPNPDILTRFESLGAQIFRSDSDGMIAVQFRDGAVGIYTENERES